VQGWISQVLAALLSMIPEKIMLHQKEEHDPEEWLPVFGKDHAPPRD
jgi:hypothetical protein